MKKFFNTPLADAMRPKNLEEVIGQEHLFCENGALQVIIQSKNVPSMILWGPTGVGKTTIAKALAKICDAEFIAISAINSGVADIRKIVETARKYVGKTILMIDEIHHFNKTQQDLFLPFVEDGTITLIGTTTENPSFYLNSALLSRCKIITLKILDENALEKILQRVEKQMEKKLPLDSVAREALISLSCGDARYLLNACEELINLKTTKLLDVDDLQKLISKRAANFDKNGDVHFNLISAFHKSLRGSDVDAALYYLARMMVAKEDPYYILRRLARFATEDIGLSDPNALLQVMAAKENYDFLGSPEGDYALSYATIYCATAPKSNSAYLAHKAAMEAAENSTQLMPPKNILNAPTKMMKEEGYGQGYIYDHDTPNCFSGQNFFPEELLKKSHPKFFEPNERGFERELKKRLEYWRDLKRGNCLLKTSFSSICK
ncbi:MAG: AAA family ATPase [Alphaproteobacteria bacterium RIFCSPLOWO2_01_FULL_40_26]|nr:MAG: AAA family ATPase [Alphaproteobacteria bacterium RIFCSPHIGHO2_02_FULL_40_34]OFW87670.1 MAG: AAA family ATPase [Alphaproteobacteria bacterium RIFCSPHIGHO2_01_FULL_40_8]OFW94885.1 MAG: AAA family ATPase [Alphaproteobacteria bacterium RIFCSPLOWO2_01_FULL_40_26]OFX10511.1 MAG: AAA family ATPase [Alphaproteobacteria bacterium RIFCSPLOWO2_02_FULL_40_19]OFX10886.1 MAG: AAA family ATPase [Alphaproteobacteria bacterium RIFCSPLOWO2_12_FULL_40_11]